MSCFVSCVLQDAEDLWKQNRQEERQRNNLRAMPRHNGDDLTRATGRMTVNSLPQPKQRKAISDETEPQIKTSQKRRATRGVCSSGSLLLSVIGEVALALFIKVVAPKDGTSKEYRQNNQGKAPRSTDWPSEGASSTNGTFSTYFATVHCN